MTGPVSCSPPFSDDLSTEVLFVTGMVAEPLTGSRTRAFHTIRALCELGCRVHHAYLRQPDAPTPRLDALAGSCPRFSHSFTATIDLEKEGVLWLSDLWSSQALQAAMDYVTALAPARGRWRVVADLSDVLLDDASAKNTLDGQQLRQLKGLEGGLLQAADVAVWVSEKEKSRALDLYGVDPGKARVIASFHESPQFAAGRGFNDRQANVCLAGSAHPHNKRAMELGIKTVWPLIFAGRPEAELHVFGSGTEQVVVQAVRPGSCWSQIRVLGLVESFIGKLSEYRVHMIPTVSGVGVKTKVFDSLAAGTPVVATQAAIEGSELEPCEAVFVSDSPHALATRAQQLLTDPRAWARAHAQALDLANHVDNFPGFCHTVREALRPVAGSPRPAAGSRGAPGAAGREPGPLPTILISTHHKTGTVLAKKIFKQIASQRGLRFLDISGGGEVVGQWDMIFDAHSRFDGSTLPTPPAGVHFIRDPRMVVVSAALYHVHASEDWLHRPRADFGGLTYQEKIRSLGSDRERFLFEMDHLAGSVIRNMTRWVAKGYPWCMNVKLEELMTDYRMEAYARMFRHLGFSGDGLRAAIDAAYRESVFNPSLRDKPHIRSREVEPWQKYYDTALHDIFSEKFPDACRALGYD